MVDKLSVNIKVLSLNVEHNFLIPFEMSVADATVLIQNAISEEYPGIKRSKLQAGALMQASTGKVLNSGCNFKQLGITHGEKLLLI